MKIRNKLLVLLIVMCIIDVVIPVPIATLILLYVLIERPPWFIGIVYQVYDLDNRAPRNQ